MSQEQFSTLLLGWYDQNAREMPWRWSPQDITRGIKPDPYKVWLSEVMLQQTMVKVVIPYYLKFVNRWPDIYSLAHADLDDILKEWAGLGYYSRARNLHSCAKKIVDCYGGFFPNTDKELRSLPGIGTYIASAIQAIAFCQPATVIDGNIERVITRLFAIQSPQAQAKKLIRKQAEKLTPTTRPGDYAQALMDLGATLCRPRSPLCFKCPLRLCCQAFQKGVQDEIPQPRKRNHIPTRSGTMLVVLNQNNCLLVERRPEGGLLGGTMGWPGYGWEPNKDKQSLPIENPTTIPGHVHHTFSHFKAQIKVQIGQIDVEYCLSDGYRLIPLDTFDPQSMPTLMRKVYDHVQSYWTQSTLAKK